MEQNESDSVEHTTQDLNKIHELSTKQKQQNPVHKLARNSRGIGNKRNRNSLNQPRDLASRLSKVGVICFKNEIGTGEGFSLKNRAGV